MSDKNIEWPPIAAFLDENFGQQFPAAQVHFCLGILVWGVHLVSNTAAQPGDQQPSCVNHLPVHVVAASNVRICPLVVFRVMVARNVKQRHIVDGGQKLQVGVGKVTAPDNHLDIRIGFADGAGVQSLYNLIAYGENFHNSRHFAPKQTQMQGLNYEKCKLIYFKFGNSEDNRL